MELQLDQAPLTLHLRHSIIYYFSVVLYKMIKGFINLTDL
jgi:hypothetical protein